MKFSSFLKHKNGLTLMELLIATSMLGAVLLAIQVASDVSRDRLLTSERRIKAQNEAAVILDHMAKNLGRAIGSNAFPGVDIDGTNTAIRVRFDANQNGIPDDDSPGDWLVYQYDASNHELNYDLTYQPRGGPWPPPNRVLSNRVEAFNFNYDPQNNFINIEVTTCYNPASTTPACSDPANPTVNMRTRVFLPQISGGSTL